MGHQTGGILRRLFAPLIVVVSLGALWSAPAFGYIGPGAGITVLGALWGVLVAIVLTIGAVLFWPVRILFRRRRKESAKSADEQTAEAGAAKVSAAETSGVEMSAAEASRTGAGD